MPLTLVAGLGHLMSGGIDVTVLESLLVGSLPGVIIASLFAPRLPDLALRLLLAATLDRQWPAPARLMSDATVPAPGSAC